MRNASRQRRQLFAVLAALLLAAFATTIALSHGVARGAISDNIVRSELPLTGDAIYSEIQRDLLKPVFVSDQMAHNTFLLDWIADGERDASKVQTYLAEVKQRYGAFTSFFISERTRRYYNADGVGKIVTESDPHDDWYFRSRTLTTPYELNLDRDEFNDGQLTVFINYRVVDRDGGFLGITGVSLSADTIARYVDDYQQDFGRSVEFFDAAGIDPLGEPDTAQGARSIADVPGLASIADDIVNGSTTQTRLSYRNADGSTTHVNSRMIPELNWYLVVSQSDRAALADIGDVLRLNVLIGLVATIAALALVLAVVGRYHRRLARIAATDGLTGIANRSAGEDTLDTVRADVTVNGSTFSLLVVDCDEFKSVNDEFGHHVGDDVIVELSRLIQSSIARPAVVARWGGEEFLVVAPGVDAVDAARLAETIRATVDAHTFVASTHALAKTVSIGVAEWDGTETGHTTFARADRALLAAKRSGRNSVAVDSTPSELVAS
jgi:diguanylate cyclase (GGDEF)-like protein